MTAVKLSLAWPKLFLGYGVWWASHYDFEATSINRLSQLCCFLDSDLEILNVSPLTGPGIKVDCIKRCRLNWSKSDGARRYLRQVLLIQLSFPSGLWYFIVILLGKLSSCPEQIIAVGSLKQNTNGYGFMFHQVLPHLSLLWFKFWFYRHFACLWKHWNKRKK